MRRQTINWIAFLRAWSGFRALECQHNDAPDEDRVQRHLRGSRFERRRPTHPFWYRNIIANPLVELQDGAVKQEMRAREVFGEERTNGGGARILPIRNFPNTGPGQAAKLRCSSWSPHRPCD
jgi:hypothetical protein